MLMGILIIVGVISSICMLQWFQSIFRKFSSEANRKTDGSVVRYLCGDYLDPQKSQVDWGWQDPIQVGQTVSFKIKFYTNSGNPFPISSEDSLTVEVVAESASNNVIAVIEYLNNDLNKTEDTTTNVVKVSFVVSKSGSYKIEIGLKGTSIANSPFVKTFLPGPPYPDNCVLARTTHALLSVVVMTIDRNHRLMIDARDEYNNACAETLSKRELNDKFDLRVREADDPSMYPAFVWEVRSSGVTKSLVLDIVMHQTGCFKASLTFDKEDIKNGKFDILVLNTTESDEVQNNLEKRNLNIWFECRLLNETELCDTDSDVEKSMEGPSNRPRLKSFGEVFVFSPKKSSSNRSLSQSSNHGKLRKVFCYITPKLLFIKEFYLKIFPKRLYTFRVSPSTKILCGDVHEQSGFPTLIISDGVQNRVVLACQRRDVLAATYIGILHSNMGGQMNTFEAKVNHFYKQLYDHHRMDKLGRNREKVELCIDRKNFLATSIKEMKNISTHAWLYQLSVHFVNEHGLDWGGVNREWIHLLCKSFFEPKEDSLQPESGGCGLFRSMMDDGQVLVLPSPSSVSGHKLKVYEFAGKLVGKCILESALGGENARQVSARFARSFLAQLIGLPITYAYFKSDDRDLYENKIQYILENDVTDLELTFSEEVYNSDGVLETVVDLIPNGSNLPVTNENKRKYLNKVAHYRLSESIKNEVEHFSKGLTSLVPDHLLSVFDENELELVMCGSSEISVDDMMKFTDASSITKQTTEWFWAVLSSYTQNDLARLLQFTTGCSQLPPDGFQALKPRFKISPTPYFSQGSLPTAHTCFNELCLPSYDSYEDLHRSLRIAITEGTTGFGLV